MTDETPAVSAAAPVAATAAQPAFTASPAPFLGIGLSHLVGAGAAAGGAGALTYLTGEIQPIVHQFIVGGTPGPDFEKSLSTLAAVALIGIAGAVANFTRRRAVPAAPQNGDLNAS